MHLTAGNRRPRNWRLRMEERKTISWNDAVQASWNIRAMAKAMYYLSAYTLSENEITIKTPLAADKDNSMFPVLAAAVEGSIMEIHDYLNSIEPPLDTANEGEKS